MAESKIIKLIITIWKYIVACYDGSLLARGINGVCDFFVKRSGGSLFVRAFKHGAFGGSWWENSGIKGFISRVTDGRERKGFSAGGFVEALLGIFNIPLRDVGTVILSFTAGMMLTMVVSDKIGTFDICAAAFLAVAGILCVLFTKSAYSLYLGSRLLTFVGGLFYDGEYKEPVNKELGDIKTIAGCAVILGTLAGRVSPFGSVLMMLGTLFAVAVIARFEIGIFALLFLVAYLPTALCAALTVLTAVGFLVAVLSGRISYKPTVMLPLFAIYIILGVFATFTSFNVKSSAFVFAVYLVFILAYAMIANTLTDAKRWRAAVVTFALGAVFVALLGIVQNFTMDTTVGSWVDENMFEDIKVRVFSTFDNPNVLGQYFIIVIPIIFALFVWSEKILQKGVWLLVFAIAFLCLLYTWSRGAWVGVVLGIAVFLLVRDRRWIVLGILALLAAPFILPDSIMNRLLSIGNTSDSSTAYRVSVWIASARMAVDFWMSGVGFGSDAFQSIYASYALNGAGYALHSHNFYIQLVTDMGVGGLIVYLLIILTACREIAAVKNNKLIKTVSLSLLGVLAGYSFQGVAENLWYNMRMSLILWIVIALIVSGARIDKGEAEC